MRNSSINEIIGNDEYESQRNAIESQTKGLRCACPGIIQSFDKETQTVTVQLSIREEITRYNSSKEWINIPLLLDVPIVIPTAGGYSITFPINKGDECLVVFSDMCINSWWALGGIQNQEEKRRHDLSDGFAILGVYSQPNKIENYSLDSMQIRNKTGSSYIELKDNEINIVSSSVKINGNEVTS